MTARVTGLHGFLSGKPTSSLKNGVAVSEAAILAETEAEKEEVRKRLASIDQSRESVQQAIHADALAQEKRGLFGRRRRRAQRESQESGVVVEMSIGESSNETARLIEERR